MFGARIPRRWVSLLLVTLLATVLVALVGCGPKEEPDPYVYDSLRRITRGDTLNVDFLFEFDAPEFEYISGDVAMIRDGNLLEFLVAENLENNYRSLAGAQLGVKKTFTPQPTHLVLQRIKRNGIVEQDSIPAPEGYHLPRLLRAGAVDLETPGAPLPEIGYTSRAIREARATFLPEEEDGDPIAIQSGMENFVFAPRHDLPDSVKMNPGEGDFAFYAVFPEATLEIVDLTPGAEWMLHMFLEKDLPIIGSFTVTYLEDSRALRRVEHEGLGHVVGQVKINWFKFGNTFVEGAAPEA